MFLGHTNPKLCVSVIHVNVVNLCKITVLRKQQLNVEILHKLKAFWKEIEILFYILKIIEAKVVFIFKKYYSHE